MAEPSIVRVGKIRTSVELVMYAVSATVVCWASGAREYGVPEMVIAGPPGTSV